MLIPEAYMTIITAYLTVVIQFDGRVFVVSINLLKRLGGIRILCSHVCSPLHGGQVLPPAALPFKWSCCPCWRPTAVLKYHLCPTSYTSPHCGLSYCYVQITVWAQADIYFCLCYCLLLLSRYNYFSISKL